MAIAYMSQSTGYSSATSNLSWSHTSSGPGIVIVGLSADSSGWDFSALTYNSSAMTLISTGSATYNGPYREASWFAYHITDSTGAKTIQGTLGGAGGDTRIKGTAVSYSGVSTSSPVGTARVVISAGAGYSTTPGSTVGGGLCISFLTTRNPGLSTWGSSITPRSIGFNGDWCAGFIGEQASSNPNMNWTNNDGVGYVWVQHVVALRAAAATSQNAGTSWWY